MTALKNQGTLADMDQIGNEISNGFLWPDGKAWENKDWEAFCGLIRAGIDAAKEVDPSIETMVHLAWGGQNAQSRAFLDKALAQGLDFDILGQSYYPKWHGTLEDLKANLTDLVQRYKLPIIVVEYSVPNIREINDIVRGLPNGKGLGTFIWEPTKWNGPALFDGKGNTKPEIDIYAEMAGIAFAADNVQLVAERQAITVSLNPEKMTRLPSQWPVLGEVALLGSRGRILPGQVLHDLQRPSGDRVVNIDRIGFDESGKLRMTGPTRSPQPVPSGCR